MCKRVHVYIIVRYVRVMYANLIIFRAVALSVRSLIFMSVQFRAVESLETIQEIQPLKTRAFLSIMTPESLVSSLLLRNKFSSPFPKKKQQARLSFYKSAFKIKRIFNLLHIDGNKFHAVLIIKRRVVSTVDSRISQEKACVPLARSPRMKTIFSHRAQKILTP